MTSSVTTSGTPTPFHDLAAFTALPRCSGLVLSPDGTRLVVGVTTLDTDGTRHHTALWEIDPEGARPARRLTRGGSDEHDAAFTPDGDLLKTATDINFYLIKEAKVALVPFSAFGTDEDVYWFRASVGASTLEDIEQLIPRVKAALAKLK